MEEQHTQDLQEIFVVNGEQPKPETNQNYPRLYGHHLCPFVEKARIALAARGVRYQSCQMDLTVKTPWHVGINGGFVPVLELPDGTILHESKVLMDFAEEAFGEQGYSILPKDAVQRAQLRLAAALADQLHPAQYPLYMKRLKFDDSDVNLLKEKLQNIENFLVKHQSESGFAFGTENPTQLDIHFYPSLSRIDYLTDSVFDAIAQKIDFANSFPHSKKLVEAIRSRPELQAALTQKGAQHRAYEKLVSLAEGERPVLTLPVQY